MDRGHFYHLQNFLAKKCRLTMFLISLNRYISGAEIGRNQLIRITDPTQCNCKRCNFWRNSQSMFYSYNSNDVVDENVAPVNQTLPFPVHEVSRNGFDDDNCQVITNKL